MSTNVSRQALAARNRSAPGKVTGKLADAITYMVEDGIPWDQAAVKAGLTVRSMRLSLKKAHVLEHMKRQRLVVIESLSAANPKRLAAIRDSDRNLAASVRAVSELEAMAGNPAARGGYTAGQSPGLTIVIESSSAQPRVVGPTIEHDDGDKNV
jgi:hypothetical protein